MTPNPAAVAVQELLDQTALLTLAVSNVTSGTRLMALKDALDGVQQRLSRVNALLIGDEEIRLEFADGAAFSDADLAEISELNTLLETSIPETLPATLTARVQDGRTIARHLEELDGKAVTFRWDAGTRIGQVDISQVLTELVERIDPLGEDVPDFWGPDEDEDEEQ